MARKPKPPFSQKQLATIDDIINTVGEELNTPLDVVTKIWKQKHPRKLMTSKQAIAGQEQVMDYLSKSYGALDLENLTPAEKPMAEVKYHLLKSKNPRLTAPPWLENGVDTNAGAGNTTSPTSQQPTPAPQPKEIPLHQPGAGEHGPSVRTGNPNDIDATGLVQGAQQQRATGESMAPKLTEGTTSGYEDPAFLKQQADARQQKIIDDEGGSPKVTGGAAVASGYEGLGESILQDKKAPQTFFHGGVGSDIENAQAQYAKENAAREAEEKKNKLQREDIERRIKNYDSQYDEDFGKKMRKLRADYSKDLPEGQLKSTAETNKLARKKADKLWTDMSPEQKKLFGTYLDRQAVAEKNAQEIFDSAQKKFEHYESGLNKIKGPDGKGEINFSSLRDAGFLSDADVEYINKTVNARYEKSNPNGLRSKIFGPKIDVASEIDKEARNLVMGRQKEAKELKDMSESYLKRVQNYESSAIAGAQAGRSQTMYSMAKAQKEAAAAAEKKAATDAAKKVGGHGWKAKAGAVGGLLALGAVLGSMMGGHGEQSNAQLYNPNPQPQYAN